MDEIDSWDCFCGNTVAEAFACDKCGLTVIGSDMRKDRWATQVMDKAIREIRNMDWSAKADR